MFKPCALIPVYDHEHAVGAVVDAILAHGLSCILVDDGSSAGCARVLDGLAAARPGQVSLVRHEVNQGKGAAVLSGFREAARLGYTHALQIDADGQHASADIPRFLQAAQAAPRAVVTGYPVYDDSVPALRLYARYLTHVWIWINTLSFAIRDSMCGFRVYPVDVVNALASRRRLGRRMNFDPEILVRLHWRGVKVVNLPTRVSYPTDGVSHFLAVRDNVLITKMHTMLFFGMLARLPILLARKLRSS